MRGQKAFRAMKFGAFLRDNWLLVVAIHPLVRALILIDPRPEMAKIQVAERFLWLSFWVVEAIVIITAARAGFRVIHCLRTLHLTVRVLATIWLAAIVIATLNATFFPPAFRSASIWLLHGMFTLALGYLATHDHAKFEYLFDRFSIIFACATAVAGAFVVASIYSIGLSRDYPFASDIPGFSHIRHSGYIFAPAIALCLGRLATTPQKPRVSMLLLALNVALCLWFGSRGPFFGLIIGLVVASITFADFRHRTFYLRSAFATIIGAVLSVVVPSPDDSAFNTLGRFLKGWADSREFTSGRTELWRDAVRLIADRPLFGYGGEQFQYVSPVASHVLRHPHDFLLQVLFDWGMVGGGAFLALLALGVYSAWESRQKATNSGRVGMFGVVCMLAYAALDGIIFYPFTIGVTLIFMVAALACSGSRFAMPRAELGAWGAT